MLLESSLAVDVSIHICLDKAFIVFVVLSVLFDKRMFVIQASLFRFV